MRTFTMNILRSAYVSAILILSASITFGQENSVSVKDALNIAGSFKPKSRSMSRSVTSEQNPELAYTCTNDTTQKSYYYVFNYSNNNGFVIISSDKRSKEIIGYSYSGNFDVNNIPDQLKDMLEVYEQELADLSITPDSLLKMDLNAAFKSRSMTLPASVSPLLENIKFNQYEPYYNMCPKHNGKSSVTGCVATAAAQIMRFYKYPSKGTGSNDYTSSTGLHSSVNFAQATYNWDNILPTYNSQATAQQNNEVAKLLFHAGVSCDMNYSSTGSSASMGSMAQALVDHFGYDENLQRYSRDLFSPEEWRTLLKTELAAGRPVLVEGRNSQSGHCFICDGYDANGLFHINWGWGGTADGYFALDNLSPAIVNKSYNDDVAFIAGIQPDKDGTKVFNNFSVDKISVPKSGQCGSPIKIEVTKLCNSGSREFNGEIGFALFVNKTLKQVIWEKTLSIDAGSYFGSYSMNVTVPNTVANGKYDLVMVSKADNQSDWEVFLSKNSVNNCISIVINSPSIKLSVNTDKTLTDFTELPIQPSTQADDGITTFSDITNSNNETNTNNTTPIVTPTVPVAMTPAKPCLADAITLNYSNTNEIDPETFTFSCNITNTGTTKFSGKLGAFLYNNAGTKCLGEIDVKNLNIEGGQTIMATFSNKLTIADGKYIVTLLYMGNDGKYTQLEPNTQSVKFVGFAKPKTPLVTKPAEEISKYGAELNPVLTKPIVFTNGNASAIDASKLQFTCTIQNQSSTQYRNYISAHLYNAANKYVGEIGTQMCSIASGETVELKFANSLQATPGKYFVTLFFVNENDKYELLQPRSSSMQSIQVAECIGESCVAPSSGQVNTNNSDFEFVSISIRGAIKVSSKEPVDEYKINRGSYIWVTGIFKNVKRTGSANLGLCIVKYKGDYVTDIKELETTTKPGQKHTVFGAYKVDNLASGKYIINGFISENGEYKPIGDDNSNYVILNVE